MVEDYRAQTTRRPPICVVTAQGDVTADRVILELNRIDADVLRIDLADFPHRARLDATASGAGWTGTLTAHGRSVRLEEISAVWWWHPTPATVEAGTSAAESEWASREANAGLAGVLAALDCRHVNHPALTHAAQNKADVLPQAGRHGLNVPATWIGNHPASAVGFAATSPHGTVCKSLVSPGIAYPDGSHGAFYTRPVEVSELDDSIALTAHQLQNAIVKQFEVRLVVVGSEMYAARIDAHSDAARADFRADYEALTYRVVDVPDTVRKGVAGLMDHYGLLYAAIDLLVDPEDEWWLIDLNPAGQHDWLQKELPGLTISAGIANLLTRPLARP
ncbi:MvdC/MvdD family ATP grasp protein [Streptomyces sp. NRRL F-5527]|uniref:MvdC/MvdD family ATP grasp protein n=1 Tax=Streptomyces sp. NRRL F-5527 TaxID=1463862 RepID=UPI0006918621|nr:hypothetical protein [Streptomyces sp. NRRL F-5527]